MDRFPIGREYISGLQLAIAQAHSEAAAVIEANDVEIEMIGTSLSALYQAATCHRMCHKSGHVLESLFGRTHNLGIASLNLGLCGLYDESLNLVRSMGEIGNLIGMSAVDKNAIKEWLTSDAKTRRNKYGPAKVREILKKAKSPYLVASDDWYSEFCERFTHVHPKTEPNNHGRDGKAWVGPVFQKDGLESVISELTNVLVTIALMCCGYFQFKDIMGELRVLIEKRAAPK